MSTTSGNREMKSAAITQTERSERDDLHSQTQRRTESAEYELSALVGEEFRKQISLAEAQSNLTIRAMHLGLESDQAHVVIEKAYRFYASREPENNPVAAARIKLFDLELTIGEKPELLLSPDAIWAFGVIRSNDIQEWERWRPIVAMHHKTKPLLTALADLKRSENCGRESQATALVRLAQEHSEFFHDESDPFSCVRVIDHLEIHSLKSRGFKRWLAHLYFETQNTAAGSEAISAAINILAGFALFKSEEVRTYVRVAASAGKLYLDLCDNGWRVIEIDETGWRVISATTCPVKFRRAHGMTALPEPERGGSIAELRPFLNVATDDDFRLVVTWLVAAFRDRGPFPVLGLHGEHGSAKSTTSRILRSLLDPSIAMLRSEPRDPRDLMIAATNGWILAFDNLSRLGSWLSDALCRLATGGGFSTRALYSDSEEIIFQAQRPTILNGIEELATRGDLLDRAIVVYLPRIEDNARMTEAEFDLRFRGAQPRILGAILDAVSFGLKSFNSVVLQRVPRMADFAIWAAATAPALGWSAEEFVRAYASSGRRANDLVLDTPVAEALRKIALPWSGTATELLYAVDELVDERAKHFREWPKSPRGLSNELRRLAPNLREVGTFIDFTRAGKQGNRLIKIWLSEDRGEPSTAASVDEKGRISLGLTADATADVTNDHGTDLFIHRQPKSSTYKRLDELADEADTEKQGVTNEDALDI